MKTCGNCGHEAGDQPLKSRGFDVCSSTCAKKVEDMFREGEAAERDGRMTRYAIAAAALNNIPWRDTETAARQVANWAANNLQKSRDLLTTSPRLVYEWSTERKWEELDATRKRNTELGESASIDLLEGYRNIHQMMDWVATHMVINPKICFRCADPAKRSWQSFPVCEDCFQRVNAPEPISRDELDIVATRIKEAMSGIPTTGSCHRDVCKQRKIRHTHYIRRAAGFLTHDGFTENRYDAQMYTRLEVELLRQEGDEVFRVVK